MFRCAEFINFINKETAMTVEEKEKCRDCKKQKEGIVFGQCEECFEKQMKENGSVCYETKIGLEEN